MFDLVLFAPVALILAVLAFALFRTRRERVALPAVVIGLLLCASPYRIAMAQGGAPTPTASTLNVTAFAVLIPGVIALSTQVATALRDALSAQVPPAGFTLPARFLKYRPFLAALVGALVAFLGSLMAAEASGGVAMSVAMLITAGGAALANLAITLPKLIYSEASSSDKSTGSPFRDAPKV